MTRTTSTPVRVPPPGIGDPASSTFYSGPDDVFAAHRATLETLTSPDYRGADPVPRGPLLPVADGHALDDDGQLPAQRDAGRGHGISAEEYVPYAKFVVESIPGFLKFYAPRL